VIHIRAVKGLKNLAQLIVGGDKRLRIIGEPVEKPPDWSLFEASRLNSPKLGVKYFDSLWRYT
jgi:hypothetical protein